MCLCNQQLDPKTKRMRAIGGVFLAVALVLKNFIEPSNRIEQNGLHGVCGFLIGLSLVFSLSALIRCRRGTHV
jgi:drug/metabolite transporter superfamily protein YnfA